VSDRAAQASLFEDRQHQLFGCAGGGGAFENDKLIALQVGRDGARGILDEAEVRLAPLVERSGDADEDCIHFAKTGEIGCRIEMFCIDVSFDFIGGNVLDVGLASIQFVDFGLIEVESCNAPADIREPECERESHVSAADNSDLDVLASKKLRFPLHTYSPCAYLSAGKTAMIAGVRKQDKDAAAKSLARVLLARSGTACRARTEEM